MYVHNDFSATIRDRSFRIPDCSYFGRRRRHSERNGKGSVTAGSFEWIPSGGRAGKTTARDGKRRNALETDEYRRSDNRPLNRTHELRKHRTANNEIVSRTRGGRRASTSDRSARAFASPLSLGIRRVVHVSREFLSRRGSTEPLTRTTCTHVMSVLFTQNRRLIAAIDETTELADNR